nr:MAG TPA: hypothetical protein [Caudoviricetes sp.]
MLSSCGNMAFSHVCTSVQTWRKLQIYTIKVEGESSLSSSIYSFE